MTLLGCADVVPVSDPAAGNDPVAEGKAQYEQHCASCHSGATAGSPTESLMSENSPDMIVAAMTTGAMRQQAAQLRDEDKIAIAKYLTRNRPATSPATVERCESSLSTAEWNTSTGGWGFDAANTRSADQSKIHGGNVAGLKLRWAFAYPDANRARSQPLVVGPLVVVGSQSGTVYGLDKETGCAHWEFRAGAEVRTGVTPLQLAGNIEGTWTWAGFFSDFQGRAYGIDLMTGQLLWRQVLDTHPAATGTGQAAAFGDTVYFPVSSVEVSMAADENYGCCTFRGSVVALNARTGERRWQSYAITNAPSPQKDNAAGTTMFGPSGAPIWGSPTLDPGRGLLYVGTGENYSLPATTTSDAILALEMSSGRLRWSRQTIANDVWNASCIEGFGSPANCPAIPGPDFDFGASPMLVRSGSGEVLVAGQKSGAVYGLNPDDGEVLWQRRLGRGGISGGVLFGMAAANETAFVPINDSEAPWEPDGESSPGLTALRVINGSIQWSEPAPLDMCKSDALVCERGISAPVSVANGLVYAPHGNGMLRIHDAQSGQERWRFDTTREFETVSGDRASGGGISGGTGPVVADDWLFVNSGYYMVLAPMPGNVLLAFSLE